MFTFLLLFSIIYSTVNVAALSTNAPAKKTCSCELDNFNVNSETEKVNIIKNRGCFQSEDRCCALPPKCITQCPRPCLQTCGPCPCVIDEPPVINVICSDARCNGYTAPPYCQHNQNCPTYQPGCCLKCC
ncbi:hypothetical protein ACOME3_005616 [Neoechinorhynchus agilis]